MKEKGFGGRGKNTGFVENRSASNLRSIGRAEDKGAKNKSWGKKGVGGMTQKS